MLLAAVALCALGSSAPAAQIIRLSIPEDSQYQSHPYNDDVWSVSTTPGQSLNTTVGIGWMLNHVIYLGPIPDEYTMHVHSSLYPGRYIAPYVPNPDLVTVTFEFDVPVVIRQVEIVQHVDGVSQIRAYAGNTPDTMQLLGTRSAIPPAIPHYTGGPPQFFPGQLCYFDLSTNVVAGKFFQFVVSQTTNASRFAIYRAFIYGEAGEIVGEIPEPACLVLLAAGACGLLRKRSRR
jgi:hypothetical protein